MTQIAKNKVVRLNYKLFADEALYEDHSEGVLYLHDQHYFPMALLEKLEGKAIGDHVELTVPPNEAYGYRHANSHQRLTKKCFLHPKALRVGEVALIKTDQGLREVTVTKLGRFNIDVDTNHPLAGKTLRYEAEVVAIRDATAIEIEHGHAHDDNGDAA